MNKCAITTYLQVVSYIIATMIWVYLHNVLRVRYTYIKVHDSDKCICNIKVTLHWFNLKCPLLLFDYQHSIIYFQISEILFAIHLSILQQCAELNQFVSKLKSRTLIIWDSNIKKGYLKWNEGNACFSTPFLIYSNNY